MATQPYLQPWPFHTETEVVLWWVSSPRQLTDEKQWCATACFEARDGQIHELDLPWGLLPFLRLGQYYANGFALTGEFIGSEIFLAVTGPPKLVPAADLLPSDSLLPNRRFMGHDLCLLFEGQVVVAVPIIEAIRVFLAPNRALAYGLFEPQFLEKIVAEASLIDGRLHLAFTREISVQALSKPVVGHLARLLYDDSFRTAWNGVAQQRLINTGFHGGTTTQVLTCSLPELKSTWKVRALSLGKLYFVFEILDVSPVTKLPFTGVSFSHPRMTAAPRKKSDYKPRRSRSPSNAPQGNTALSTKPRGPCAPKEARELKIQPLPIFNFKAANIVRLPKLRDVAAIGIASAADEATTQPTGRKQNTMVSVADDTSSSEARFPAGEFKPVQITEEGLNLRSLPLLCPATSGLSFFAAALNSLGQHCPTDLDIRWCLRTFPIVETIEKSSRFALVGNLGRQYALVCLRWPQTTAWLLEFGQPDHRALSTLVFQPLAGAKLGVLTLVEDILQETLTPDGNWQESKLAEMHAENKLSYVLTRHLSRLADVWARRLYHKAADLAGGRPRFMRRPQ